MDKQLENGQNRLLERYRQWQKDIQETELFQAVYSYPYYLHIPENWYSSKYRILIVGEEGYGEKRYNESIEIAQKFNQDYLKSQLGKGIYPKSGSAFWGRIRKINDLFEPGTAAITWTNLDKIHRSGKGNCRLTKAARMVLHQYPIFKDEISILKPTHIIYFGWYGLSLEKELPAIHQQLYCLGASGEPEWKTKHKQVITSDGIVHFFTYHPGWGRRQTGYEEGILNDFTQMKEPVERQTDRAHE